MKTPVAVGAVVACLLLASTRAEAIPAFARKYETSCETCHTVYPKLTPFGEAFRRNGYRFPGVDSDFIKQNIVSLGNDAYKDLFPNSVWPSMLPGSVPLAFGFNGQAIMHPDKTSGGGAAANGTQFDMSQLVQEAHIWAGGSFDDKLTYWGEATLSDGGSTIEHAQVLWNDIVGPKHAVNLVVGKGFATLSSFGPHSAYAADLMTPATPVTALYGAKSDPWNTGSSYMGAEVNGVVAGRFDYSLGLNSSTNIDARPSDSVYGHLGYKLGGSQLDGEGESGLADPKQPWQETALTLDLWTYKATSRITDVNSFSQPDNNLAFGLGVRGQYKSLELDLGGYLDGHKHAYPLTTDGSANGSAVNATVAYAELSYIVYPWLVPAVRVESTSLDAVIDTAGTHQKVSDLRIMPTLAMLVRPNIRVILSGLLESANGAPVYSVVDATGTAVPTTGNWSAANGQSAPADDKTSVKTELEQIQLSMAYAF